MSVKTESSDSDEVTITLVGFDDRSIVLSLTHYRTDEVHGHFPPLGQIATPA